MPENEWIPVIVLGSPYEEQVTADGKFWRHRPLKEVQLIRRDGAETFAADVEIPWVPGRVTPQS